MQLESRQFGSFVKAGIAVSLAGLVLLLNAMAASPSLHELIHPDADSAGHHCAATLFAHGQVDSAVTEAPVVVLPAIIEAAPRVVVSDFVSILNLLPAGRAPPASAASIA